MMHLGTALLRKLRLAGVEPVDLASGFIRNGLAWPAER